MIQCSALQRPVAVFVLLLALHAAASAQDGFDLQAYRAFLSANETVSTSDLVANHPAGVFRSRITAPAVDPIYLDSIGLYYGITDFERSLLGRHGFVVTERISPNSFGAGFMDVFEKDLPVYVSADAILHAVHMSYDLILREVEESTLIGLLDHLLQSLHGTVSSLESQYGSTPGLHQPLRDLDVYLTVARSLLAEVGVEPYFTENREEVGQLLALIEAEQVLQRPLFSDACRSIDFSQFTVRGHYTLSEPLSRYFQAMIWLGRTEIYLIAPVTAQCTPTEADVHRQTLVAALLSEALDLAAARADHGQIDRIVRLFVGDSDNVTTDQLRELLERLNLSATALADKDQLHMFQDSLRVQPFAEQQILSQILFSGDVTDPDGLKPASAFLLFGQRFVIDSYVSGHVVFDEVVPTPEHPRPRMLPSTLDVLFALGNDAAAQLLEPELETYGYARQLSALRYLIDTYTPDFWEATLYNGWLGAIRALNPAPTRDHLPAFMQTAAWWQYRMNTQLASWAQLRHDNLLYAKQSYTGGIVCEFPYSLVEPVPEFFGAVQRFAMRGVEVFGDIGVNPSLSERVVRYFSTLADISGRLADIARAELGGVRLSTAQQQFLREMIRTVQTCGPQIDGWYTGLFFGGPDQSLLPDLVVADVHTAPTDENGNMVGWVVHVGTGPLDMAIVIAPVPGVGPVSFIGPVLSYYEHLSTGFRRLTDEAWQTAYSAEPSFRPDWVNLYLADGAGGWRGDSPSLVVTGVERQQEMPRPTTGRLAENYPNPFRRSTIIGFEIDGSQGISAVDIAIYAIDGRLVTQIIDEHLPPGKYTAEWDGRASDGSAVASGVYFARLRVADRSDTVPLVRVK